MDGCSYGQEPLQMILKIEETVKLIEKVTADLSSGSYACVKPSILSLCFNLKRHGHSLERLHGEHLKRLQQAMRSACRNTKLDLVSRVHLLEIIEMRSLNWAPNHHVTNFYKMKLDEIKELSETPTTPTAAQTNCSKPSSRLNANAPDFCLTTSNLLMSIPKQPTKPVSFNPDCSPFVSLHQPPFNQKSLIGNSGDNLVSNPVNVPTSRNQSGEERLNGGTDDISSKDAVTILRYDGSLDNFSVQDDNSIKDAITVHGDNNSKDTFTVQGDNIGKDTTAVLGYYGRKDINDIQSNNSIEQTSILQSDNEIKTSVTVHTKDGEITLTSMSMDLLHAAKNILEEGLKDKIVVKTGPSPTTSHNVANPDLIYQNPELLELATSHLYKLPPTDWEKTANEIPSIVKIKPLGKLEEGDNQVFGISCDLTVGQVQ